ncbi:MAG TPA: hypothetical protein VN081_03880 [Dongiaceae bacterium]|nr:hypothetical protein [Dongiaceae bacterium]
MYDLIIALFKDKPALVIVLIAFFLLPAYMAYRIENAVNNLSSRMECGTKIHVQTVAELPR